MSTTEWHTIAVSYHDEAATPDLILDAVGPLFAELPQRASFGRHWRRGPHVRLNVRATEDELRATVLPAVDRWVGGHLRAHPSTAALDLARLLPAHRRLAAAEADDGPLAPLRPDNTIAVEPYDARQRVLGGPAAAAYVADFHAEATPAAFAALRAMRAEGQRLWTAFELMAATAHAFSGGGVELGYVSFRTHAEIFLARNPARDRVRAEWDRVSRASRPALRARLDRATATAGPAARDAWIDVLRSVRERGIALMDAGLMPMTPTGDEPDPGEATPFLRSLLAIDDFRGAMMPSAPFRRYRLLLNLLYLQLTRLGIRPAERSMLAHLLADTVEEVYGVDALTLVSQRSARLARAA